MYRGTREIRLVGPHARWTGSIGVHVWAKLTALLPVTAYVMWTQWLDAS